MIVPVEVIHELLQHEIEQEAPFAVADHQDQLLGTSPKNVSDGGDIEAGCESKSPYRLKVSSSHRRRDGAPQRASRGFHQLLEAHTCSVQGAEQKEAAEGFRDQVGQPVASYHAGDIRVDR